MRENSKVSSPGRDPIIRRLEIFMKTTKAEETALRQMRSGRRDVHAGEVIIGEGDNYECAFFVQQGWTYAYRLLPDGRRQVLSFYLPGDVIAYHSAVFEVAEYTIDALTDVILTPFSSESIILLCSDQPRLSLALSWLAARNENILAEHVVRIGRRSAYERIGHFLLEIFTRLKEVGMTEGEICQFPITQELLADFLGLSVVHVNRTLQKLRKNGLIELANGSIKILKPSELSEQSKFDEDYLSNEEIPKRMQAKLSHPS